MRDKNFDDLVAMTRTPIADLAAKVQAAHGDQVAIDAAINAAAEGLAKCYWDGMFYWLEHGRQLAMEGGQP